MIYMLMLINLSMMIMMMIVMLINLIKGQFCIAESPVHTAEDDNDYDDKIRP